MGLFSVTLCAQGYKPGTTTALWRTPTTADFTDARQQGFEYVEVALNQCYRSVPEKEVIPRIHALKAKIDSAGLKVWSIHLPFSRTLDISVLDDSLRAENVKFIAEMIKQSAIFRPQRLVLHPSSEPIEDSIREQRIANCICSIGILLESAKAIGAQLCVENLPRTCLGNTPEELLRIIEGYPEVGICFDTNHYFQGTPLHFVQVAGHRIATLHVSDYDGANECHWLPGDGTTPWGELVYAIRKSGYEGCFMFETTKNKEGNPVSATQLSESFRMIGKKYDECAAKIN